VISVYNTVNISQILIFSKDEGRINQKFTMTNADVQHTNFLSLRGVLLCDYSFRR
jgi:hypothetical protein